MPRVIKTVILLIFMFGSLYAQTGGFTSEPVIGENLQLIVDEPTNITSILNLLCYRRGGETQFTIVQMDPSGDGSLSSTIPGSFLTEQGLEYFVSFSDGSNSVTFPAGTDENNPAIVEITVEDYQTQRYTLPGNTYRMFSIPLNLQQTPTIDAVIADDFGPYNSDIWRIFRWENGQYNEYPALNALLTPGNAFWIIRSEAGFFDVDSALTIDSKSPQSVPLAGNDWNQIAVPYGFSFNWRNVQVSLEGEDKANVDDENIVGPYFFNGVEYEIAETLDPWEGYFVRNDYSFPVSLFFDPAYEADTSNVLAKSKPVYQLQLSAVSSDGYGQDTQNFIGYVAPEERQLRYPNPPAIRNGLSLSIEDGDQLLMQNLVPLKTDGAYWDIVLESKQDQEITFSITETGQRPTGQDLYLLDKDRYRLVTLDQNQMTLRLKENEKKRYRVLISGKEAASELSGGIPLIAYQFELDNNYPNPFNPSTQIRYQLSQKEQIDLSIYNLLGQKVRTLYNGIQLTGAHTAVWDGRNDFGQAVASGIYLYQLKTETSVKTRKMTLIK